MLKHLFNHSSLYGFIIILFLSDLHAKVETEQPQVAIPETPSLINKQDQQFPERLPISTLPPPSESTLVYFSYKDADIEQVVNDLAALKDVNIVLPQMGNKIEGKVTLSLDHKITIDEAWNLLNTILDIAGYSLILNGIGYQIVKNTKSITHEPVPLFIETPLDQLPESGRIRYLTFLANIKITDEASTEILKVLDEILPKADPATENKPYKIDSSTNALLLMSQAPDIKAAMRIVQQLDKPGFQENIEVVRLRHTQADTVAKLLDSIIKKPADVNRYHLDTQKPEEGAYFSRATRIIPEARTNSLIIVGRNQAINRIKQFMQQYIDVELESGKSILHVYQLQYLDAEYFAQVLERIVKSEPQAGVSQATTQQGIATGPERFFEDVIIRADRPIGIKEPASTDTAKITEREQTPYFGGNKLIIAARNDDWKRIKKLIEQLDTPIPTVVAEIMIMDLATNDQRLLGTILRNPAKIPFINQAAAQSAQTGPGIIPDSWSMPQTIGFNQNPDGSTISADLLRLGFTAAGARDDAGTRSIASFILPGGTAMSFNDSNGRTFAMSQLVQLFGYDKIISHPHVIVKNNVKALVSIGEERLVPDTGSGGVGGTIRKNAKLTADLKVVITPRISANGIVNLQVAIDINEFLTPNASSQIPAVRTRKVATNANVQTGGILAIGGLTQINDAENVNKIPVLGDIPIFGWFGKQRAATVNKNSLTVFICPIIIEPRLRGGASEYTQDHIALAKNYSNQSENFNALRDPITRWFFEPDPQPRNMVENFLQKDELKEVDYMEPPLVEYKKARKKRVAEALQEEPIIVKNKQETNQQLKEKMAQIQNPFKPVTHDPRSSKVDPQS